MEPVASCPCHPAPSSPTAWQPWSAQAKVKTPVTLDRGKRQDQTPLALRRYLEEAVAPAADAIRDATSEAVRQIEQFAEAQATWLEQVSLKDRASFLDEQKSLHDDWKADMEALVEGQNRALRQVVMQTAASLRTHALSAGSSLATGDAPQAASTPTGSRPRFPWGWMSAGMLLGTVVTVALATVGWVQLSGR